MYVSGLLLGDVRMTQGVAGSWEYNPGTVPTVGYGLVCFYMERVQAVSFSTESTLVLSSTVQI